MKTFHFLSETLPIPQTWVMLVLGVLSYVVLSRLSPALWDLSNPAQVVLWMIWNGFNDILNKYSDLPGKYTDLHKSAKSGRSCKSAWNYKQSIEMQVVKITLRQPLKHDSHPW